ncbi:putative basic proline-rich protein-like [Iris pallida]|uniref:Basic proline-rich protein-like n=1 Tax=Iris pallida TaxID=29817 RepID=A0AAX6HI32_IRIPA|nr:putative basic proline-rich protein-like [Iris pallida]
MEIGYWAWIPPGGARTPLVSHPPFPGGGRSPPDDSHLAMRPPASPFSPASAAGRTSHDRSFRGAPLLQAAALGAATPLPSSPARRAAGALGDAGVAGPGASGRYWPPPSLAQLHFPQPELLQSPSLRCPPPPLRPQPLPPPPPLIPLLLPRRSAPHRSPPPSLDHPLRLP